MSLWMVLHRHLEDSFAPETQAFVDAQNEVGRPSALPLLLFSSLSFPLLIQTFR